jgi:hypothetical protein
MGNKHLCLIFGITPSICSRVIKKMLLLVVRKLKRHRLAKIKFPDEEKMASFARQINQREPVVNDVIGFMDGIALQSECTLEAIMQNSMYGDYYSDTMINSIFAYGPDGKVFLCSINYPGSWHNASITANILPYIRNNIGNYKMCVDQGFPKVETQLQFLLGQLVKSKLKHLLLICDHTYYVCRTFMYHCDRQVNGA